ATGPQLFGLGAQYPQLARRLAGCARQTDRERPQPVDSEEVTALAVRDHARRAVLEGGAGQARRPEVVGLEDMAVGGDDLHCSSWPTTRRPAGRAESATGSLRWPTLRRSEEHTSELQSPC